MSVDAHNSLACSSVQEIDGSEILVADAIVALDDGLGSRTSHKMSLIESGSTRLIVDKKSMATWRLVHCSPRFSMVGVVESSEELTRFSL